MKVDVVVIGSGAGGLTTAIVAAKAGLDVLVVESTEYFGGTSAISGGGVWVPCNHHMAKIGVQDSRAEVETYVTAVLGNFYDAKKIAAYLDATLDMLDFLEQNSEVRFNVSRMPDYYTDKPGWKIGRCLNPVDYDGAKLGPYLSKLRPPLLEMTVFDGMQINILDSGLLRQWNKSPRNFFFAAGRVLQYVFDCVRHGRGAHLSNGNALTAQLLKSALDAGARLWSNAPARNLLFRDGVVSGVVVERDGQETRIEASRGVVLATGGFGANDEMRRRYIKHADYGWSMQPEGNQGDGIRMGIDAGGGINPSNQANAIWAPISVHKRKDGSLAKFPSFVMDRHCPGSIMVDANTGRRFVNEGLHYQNFGDVAHAGDIRKVWMISDAGAVRKYGMGMAKPAPFSVKPWVRKGYIIEAPSIHELAVRIGLEPNALARTVDEFNVHADAGVDPEFQRGQDYFSAFMGDATNKPNPGLGALREAPFYALEIRLGDLCTLAGLQSDEFARVIGRDEIAIPGLYAAGADNNSVTMGMQPGGGMNLSHAMSFGYVAARHIASMSGQT